MASAIDPTGCSFSTVLVHESILINTIVNDLQKHCRLLRSSAHAPERSAQEPVTI